MVTTRIPRLQRARNYVSELLHFLFNDPHEEEAIIKPTSQIRKLRLRGLSHTLSIIQPASNSFINPTGSKPMLLNKNVLNYLLFLYYCLLSNMNIPILILQGEKIKFNSILCSRSPNSKERKDALFTTALKNYLDS